MFIEFIGVGIVGIIVLAVVFFIWSAFWLWWQSILSNATVGLLQIIFMRFRKVNPSIIVTVRITAKKAGLDLSADELEAHTLAGGAVERVVQALISASKASISLSYDRACAIDLAGRDLLGRIELPPIRSMIVGSMGVSFSALLLDRCPQASVTYGCLEHLVREIPRLRERYGVDPGRVAGSHVHGGDPNADRWGDERFDLVFLTKKMILDPENRVGEAFARKAFDVLTPNGVAILWETVHPADAPTPVAQAMEAMLDLGASPTGFVLTDRGLVELLTGIGFVSVEIVRCLGGSTSFIIARR